MDILPTRSFAVVRLTTKNSFPRKVGLISETLYPFPHLGLGFAVGKSSYPPAPLLNLTNSKCICNHRSLIVLYRITRVCTINCLKS